MSYSVADVVRFMESFAPPALAESWDNTGLLVGDWELPVERMMTCLTITPESAGEAMEQKIDLLIAHHPLPFRAIQKITTETTTGKLLWNLIRHGVGIYSPHTSFDSAAYGINQQIAEGLGLQSIVPLISSPEVPGGTGRLGELPGGMRLGEFLKRVKSFFHLPHVAFVGDVSQMIRRVAIGCGAAGEFLKEAQKYRCDVFLTGETNFHTLLEAKATGIGLVLMTHYASERFACERLAEILREEFPGVEIGCSEREKNPLQYDDSVTN